MNTNKIIGSRFEAEFAETLSKNGWWVHRLQQSSGGQPADIIAVKRREAHLIDCKVCQGNFFTLSRMEENQRNAMWLWQQCGNGVGWFAISICGRVFMVPFNRLMEAENHVRSLGYAKLAESCLTLEEWLQP